MRGSSAAQIQCERNAVSSRDPLAPRQPETAIAKESPILISRGPVALRTVRRVSRGVGRTARC